MVRLIFIYIFFGLFTLAHAAKVFPVPFVKQLNDSDGIIHGEFLGISYRKHRDGKILTEASFRIIESQGIGQKFLVNKNLFKIYYSGGVWQGFNYLNKNAPKLKMNEKYVVLVNKTSFGFTPFMENLGFYHIQDEFGENYLRSIAFPDHQRIGKVSMRTFNLWIKTIYGSALEEIHNDKFVSKTGNKDYSRAPASLEDKEEEAPKIGLIWITLIFGFLGAMRIRKFKKAS